MNRSTTSLSFPDVVWLALLLEDHVHRSRARVWWEATDATIAFTRFTGLSVLRLLTTAGAMNGRPLGMDAAWRAYDRLFEDDRVAFAPEPAEVEARFREYASGRTASPKVWADAWLLAFAKAANGTLVTFDRALAARGATVCYSRPAKVREQPGTAGTATLYDGRTTTNAPAPNASASCYTTLPASPATQF